MIAWMLYSLLVTAMLGCAALAAERALALLRRPTRFAWAGAMALSVGLPLASVLFRSSGPVAAPSGVWEKSSAVWRAPAELVDRVAAGNVNLQYVIAGLWLAVTLALLGWIGWSWIRLSRDRAGWREQVIDGHRVLISTDVGPAVVDPFRGAIVIPQWLATAESEERRAAMLHELAHRAAGDARLVWSALLLAVAVPWNIGLWWLQARLRRAVESDCDARVLAGGIQPRLYANLLLRVSARAAAGSLVTQPLMSERGTLGRRIEAMIDRPIRFRGARTAAFGLLAAALAVLACEAPAPQASDRVSGPEATDDVVEAQAYGEARPNQRPERVSCPVPEYPRMMREAGIEGQVTVQFVVRSDGSVDAGTVEVLQASHRAFEAPARAMVRGCIFRPAAVNGESVRAVLEMPIAFMLQDRVSRDVVELVAPSAVTVTSAGPGQERKN